MEIRALISMGLLLIVALNGLQEQYVLWSLYLLSSLSLH